MPAAAVIPAPIAYIKVVAVKKLVVEFLTAHLSGPASKGVVCRHSPVVTLSREAAAYPSLGELYVL